MTYPLIVREPVICKDLALASWTVLLPVGIIVSLAAPWQFALALCPSCESALGWLRLRRCFVKLANLDTSSVARKPGVSNHPLLFLTTVTLRNTEGLSPHFATNRSGVHGRCHERVLKINDSMRPSKSRLRLDVIYYLSHVTLTVICIHRFISRAFVAFILPPESTHRVLRSPILYPNQDTNQDGTVTEIIPCRATAQCLGCDGSPGQHRIAIILR